MFLPLYLKRLKTTGFINKDGIQNCNLGEAKSNKKRGKRNGKNREYLNKFFLNQITKALMIRI